MSDGTPERTGRRRRRRPRRAQGTPAPASSAPAAEPQAAPVAAAGAAVPGPPSAAKAAAPRKKRAARDAGTDRGLRDLVGAGRSQLGVSGALRARDVNRPTEEDIAEAERTVTIVRRNWQAPRQS